MPPKGRDTFGGTLEQIADRLEPFARSKSFVRYDESTELRSVRTSGDVIHKYSGLLNALHELQPNLSFQKSNVQAAVHELIRRRSWVFSESDLHDYVSTMTSRVRNLCHATQTAALKHPQTAWVKNLPWNISDSQRERNSKENDKDKMGIEYFFGWDSEIRHAWRTKVGGMTKEPSEEFENDKPDTPDSECLRAVWPDGTVYEIPDVTLGDWRKMKAPRESKNKASSAMVWQGEHKQSHNRLHISWRSDRGLLLVLFDGGRQILQVKVADIGDPSKEEVKEKAVLMMKCIGSQYANDEINKKCLRFTRKHPAEEDARRQSRGQGNPEEAQLCSAGDEEQRYHQEGQGH